MIRRNRDFNRPNFNQSNLKCANRRASYLKTNLARAFRATAPALFALTFASVAHAQGTMDFSGAQTLMGTFKTTTLQTIREGAETSGYIVEGFAPTSKAAGQLREAGIDARTLQSFLARGQNHPSPDPTNRHLYMLDESSLASTKQMRSFLGKLNPEDRVLVIGDTRQHQGVDAGRPFQQMQNAGMQTSQLDRIMRQKDPELLKAVQHLAKNETVAGINMLAEQGRIAEIQSVHDRIAAIAKDYAASPENTIIVSPDNRSRQQINEAVRIALRKGAGLAEDGQILRTLTHRSDMAYVAISRASDDVRIYTNDAQNLGTHLSHEVSKTAALDEIDTLLQSKQDVSMAKSFEAGLQPVARKNLEVGTTKLNRAVEFDGIELGR